MPFTTSYARHANNSTFCGHHRGGVSSNPSPLPTLLSPRTDLGRPIQQLEREFAYSAAERLFLLNLSDYEKTRSSKRDHLCMVMALVAEARRARQLPSAGTPGQMDSTTTAHHPKLEVIEAVASAAIPSTTTSTTSGASGACHRQHRPRAHKDWNALVYHLMVTYFVDVVPLAPSLLSRLAGCTTSITTTANNTMRRCDVVPPLHPPVVDCCGEKFGYEGALQAVQRMRLFSAAANDGTTTTSIEGTATG